MYNLYSRNLKNYYLVQLGLLRSPLVYFSPIWSTGEISPVGSRVSKNRDPFGEIFFSPDALFRPRAYKNIASGEKKFPQLDLESLRLEIHWGNFFFPRCFVFVGSRPKQSIWGKIFPSMNSSLKDSSSTENFFFFSPLDMQNYWICEPKTGKSWTYKTAE